MTITDQGFFVGGIAGVLAPEAGTECKATVGDDTDPQPGSAPPTLARIDDEATCRSLVCDSDDSTGCYYETPCYDFEALTCLLGKVKDEYPNEQTIILVPESGIRYETLIAVMDASREQAIPGQSSTRELFPAVMIAGGVPSPSSL